MLDGIKAYPRHDAFSPYFGVKIADLNSCKLRLLSTIRQQNHRALMISRAAGGLDFQ